MEREYLGAPELEAWTGIPESSWRYFAIVGKGPASMKISRRRLWKRSVVEAWLREQERAATA